MVRRDPMLMLFGLSMRGSKVAIVVWAGLGACLPEGGPGVGRQLVAERGLADVAFSPEIGDQPGGYLVFTRPSPSSAAGDSPDALARDLHVIGPDGGDSHLRAERLPPQVRSLYFWDQRGRLYLRRDVQRMPAGEDGTPGPVSWELLGLDPLGGDEVSFGRARRERLSPARTRLFYQRPDGAGFLRRLDDGAEVALAPDIRQSLFIDEDLYFVDDSGLRRLAAGAEAPELLLSGVGAFRPVSTPLGDLVVRQPLADGKETLALVRLSADGATAVDQVSDRLIGDPFVSPDGRFLAWVSVTDKPMVVGLNIIDLSASFRRNPRFGVHDWRPDPPASGPPPPPLIDAAFRPGSSEVWFGIHTTVTVVVPGARQISRPIYVGPRIGPRRSADLLVDDEPSGRWRAPAALFTGDGRRWIFQGSDGRPRLGNADDPESDQGVTVGTFLSRNDLLELVPGRRLAVWLLPGNDRADLYLLEVERDELRFVARDVGATLFGTNRLLAIARKVGDRRATGDLVLVDLDTGAETLLAQNVSEFAVPPCAGCDPTAPGAPFAYVVQARVPWRHEGLWIGELP
jgi:hypothetical protein